MSFLGDSNATGSFDETLINVIDGPQKDAFGRIRVSNPQIVFDSYFVENGKDFLFSDVTSGSGAVNHNSTVGGMEMTVTGASGDVSFRQTKEYFHYVPGVSPIVEVSTVFGSSHANNVQRVGQFDDNNGLYFQYANSTLSVGIRSNVSGSVVDTTVAQSSWNLDKLDGTGRSGITIDPAKALIIFLDYQWLSIGRVRFGTVIDGQTIYVHEENHANVLTTKYMRTASLPLRFENRNTGATAGASTLSILCCSIIAEGSLDGVTTIRSANRGDTVKSIVNNEYRPLVSVRLQSGVRGTIIPKAISAVLTTADPAVIQLRLNPTLSNGTSWTNISNSIAQQDIGSADVTGGDVIWTEYVFREGQASVQLDGTFEKVVADYSGTRDILSLVIQSLNNNANAYGAINFGEVY